MHIKYQAWIDLNISTDAAARHQCMYQSRYMQEAFPELIRVRGHYRDCWDTQHPHWWLKTTDGQIVDPTARQFTDKGAGEYLEHDESFPEPTGRCYNCGELNFTPDGCCSRTCAAEYLNVLNGDRDDDVCRQRACHVQKRTGTASRSYPPAESGKQLGRPGTHRRPAADPGEVGRH